MFVHECRAQIFRGDRTEHRLHGRGPARFLRRPAGTELQGSPGGGRRTSQELPPAEVASIEKGNRFHGLPGVRSVRVRAAPRPWNFVGRGCDYPTPKGLVPRQKAGLGPEGQLGHMKQQFRPVNRVPLQARRSPALAFGSCESGTSEVHALARAETLNGKSVGCIKKHR